MNEHELQDKLTRKWTADGLEINGRRHFLVAWEVMSPSWQVNDASKSWSEPSVDFLVANEEMRLTVVELKSKIVGIKPGWLALSQVSHRAVKLAQTISQANIEKAYSACWGGEHGRVDRPKSLLSLAENHRQFFDLPSPARLDEHELQRCVAAQEFGPGWSKVLTEFNRLSGAALVARVCEELTSKTAAREVNRLKDLSSSELDSLRSPVVSLEVTLPD